MTGTYPALEIAPGKLTGQDVGGFAGVLEDLPIGMLDAGECSTASSASLTPVVAGQSLLDDVIVVTPPQGFQKNALTVYAQPDSANQIAVTVCNVGGADDLNVGLRSFRYLTIDTGVTALRGSRGSARAPRG